MREMHENMYGAKVSTFTVHPYQKYYTHANSCRYGHIGRDPVGEASQAICKKWE